MKIRNRYLIRIVARLVSEICRGLYCLCRHRLIEKVPGTMPYRPNTNDEKFIYCNWHDGILGPLFCGRSLNMAALTSRHNDGEYVAEIMHAVGITPIRGSNNHGGSTAAKQIMTATADHHITITTDGPRGPRRVVKPGIVFLASQTGRRIIPVAGTASRAWYPKGKWTDLMVPKPLSTNYLLAGEPFAVPPDLSKSELEPYRVELQRRMDELQAEADALASGQPQRMPQVRSKAA